MKKAFKKIGYKLLAILSLILISQSSVLADSNSGTQTNEPLSGGMVVLYFAILLALIIAPVFKKSSSRA